MAYTTSSECDDAAWTQLNSQETLELPELAAGDRVWIRSLMPEMNAVSAWFTGIDPDTGPAGPA